jgi:hypothetical protein
MVMRGGERSKEHALALTEAGRARRQSQAHGFYLTHHTASILTIHVAEMLHNMVDGPFDLDTSTLMYSRAAIKKEEQGTDGPGEEGEGEGICFATRSVITKRGETVYTITYWRMNHRRSFDGGQTEERPLGDTTSPINTTSRRRHLLSPFAWRGQGYHRSKRKGTKQRIIDPLTGVPVTWGGCRLTGKARPRLFLPCPKTSYASPSSQIRNKTGPEWYCE